MKDVIMKKSCLLFLVFLFISIEIKTAETVEEDTFSLINESNQPCFVMGRTVDGECFFSGRVGPEEYIGFLIPIDSQLQFAFWGDGFSKLSSEMIDSLEKIMRQGYGVISQKNWDRKPDLVLQTFSSLGKTVHLKFDGKGNLKPQDQKDQKKHCYFFPLDRNIAKSELRTLVETFVPEKNEWIAGTRLPVSLYSPEEGRSFPRDRRGLITQLPRVRRSTVSRISEASRFVPNDRMKIKNNEESCIFVVAENGEDIRSKLLDRGEELVMEVDQECPALIYIWCEKPGFNLKERMLDREL